ncbi:hypothetical protein E2C01_041846 [Portunus trituberculatus]|uniref:Uncharacterized protein n=1 Tax=Portunus trituberculatus TaxID=210409 RepID=A0A5B7FKX8_PORTR|nr:hypothetical protein [Portunus trituberculatus]
MHMVVAERKGGVVPSLAGRGRGAAERGRQLLLFRSCYDRFGK